MARHQKNRKNTNTLSSNKKTANKSEGYCEKDGRVLDASVLNLYVYYVFLCVVVYNSICKPKGNEECCKERDIRETSQPRELGLVTILDSINMLCSE